MKRFHLLRLLAVLLPALAVFPDHARAANDAAASAAVSATCGTQSWPLTTAQGSQFYAVLTVLQNGNLCIDSAGGLSANATIISPLGPTTAPAAAVAITDTGTPITGQTLGAGGQGLTGWLSQVYAAILNGAGATGAAVPPDAIYMGMNSSGNLVGLVGDLTNGLWVNVKSAASTAVTQGTSPWIVAGGGTAGTAATGVLTIQGIASMTKLLVTPDSVALPANQSVNVSQVNGITTLTGAGATGTGAQRVTAAQDTTTIAGSAPGTAGSASANVMSVQGVASMTPVLTNPGTAANWGVVATAAAPPANAIYLGANAGGATGGHVAGLITCDSHVFKHITSATDTLAVQGVASQTIRICGWRSRAAGVATWFLENTASTNANCSSSNTQITGVATEAANTGETMLAAFWTGLANTSGNGLCINSTGTGGVDVDIWYNQY